MPTGNFDYLVRIIEQYKSDPNTSKKLADISQALGGITAKGEKNKSIWKEFAKSMSLEGLDETQIKSVGENLKGGADFAKLTSNQVNLLRESLLKAGATQPQIANLMKSLDAKGVIPVKPMNDFQRALMRVAIVVPVWMAARAVMTGVLSTIREGFKIWEEFDRALIKSKAVIHDYSGTTDEAMGVLESSIRSFSKTTGISLATLASSFYRFGTVGIAFEASLSGAIASAKLAKATLGDTDTIARSLAMAYRLLGDSIDKSLNPMQKQESLAGKIYKLWQTNAFESNEFAGSLNNFASTANVANFTIDQTIALLAALGTAGVQGSKGGALLKTSIFKLVENLDMLASTLGLSVNPEMETTFDVFMRVLDAVNKLSQTSGMPVEAMKAIQDIFGGVRGAQAISALNALLPELKKNLIDLGKDPQTFISGLNDRVEEVKDTVSGQLDIFRQLKGLIGEAFVRGVTGAEDFKNALSSINSLMEQTIITGEQVGGFFFGIAHPIIAIKKGLGEMNEEEEIFWKRVQDAEDGVLSLIETLKVAQEIQDRIGKEGWGVDLINRIKETAKQIAISGQLEGAWNKAIIDFNNNVIQKENKRKEQVKKLSIELQEQLNLSKQELEIIKKQASGATEQEFAQENLNGLIEILVNKHNELIDASGKQVKQISVQEVLSAVLANNYEKVLNIFKGMEVSAKEINSLAEARNKIEAINTQEYLKQQQNFRNLAVQFEKAGGAEQDKLRRVTELMGLSPEDLGRAIENDVYDKEIVLEYWNYFSEQGQKAVEDILIKMNELTIPGQAEDILLQNLNNLEEANKDMARVNEKYKTKGYGLVSMGGKPPTSITPFSRSEMQEMTMQNITNKGAENINITVESNGKLTAEEQAKLIAEQVKDSLLADQDFQNSFSKELNIR